MTTTIWDTDRRDKADRLSNASRHADGKIVPTDSIVDLLQDVLRPGDRVALEGNNQKQADFLSRALAQVDPERIHDLHMLFSSISRPEHLDIFEDGIARRVDFAFSGPQSARVAQLVDDGTLQVGAIHTYLELYPDVPRPVAEGRDGRSSLCRQGRKPSTPVRTPRTHRRLPRPPHSGRASSSPRSTRSSTRCPG